MSISEYFPNKFSTYTNEGLKAVDATNLDKKELIQYALVCDYRKAYFFQLAHKCELEKEIFSTLADRAHNRYILMFKQIQQKLKKLDKNQINA